MDKKKELIAKIIAVNSEMGGEGEGRRLKKRGGVKEEFKKTEKEIKSLVKELKGVSELEHKEAVKEDPPPKELKTEFTEWRKGFCSIFGKVKDLTYDDLLSVWIYLYPNISVEDVLKQPETDAGLQLKLLEDLSGMASGEARGEERERQEEIEEDTEREYEIFDIYQVPKLGEKRHFAQGGLARPHQQAGGRWGLGSAPVRPATTEELRRKKLSEDEREKEDIEVAERERVLYNSPAQIADRRRIEEEEEKKEARTKEFEERVAKNKDLREKEERAVKKRRQRHRWKRVVEAAQKKKNRADRKERQEKERERKRERKRENLDSAASLRRKFKGVKEV